MSRSRHDRILLLATARDVSNAQQLEGELKRRHFAVDLSTYGAGYARGDRWDPHSTHVVALIPRPHTSTDGFQPPEATAHLVSEYPNHRVTIVAHVDDGLPQASFEQAYQVVWDSGRLSQLLSEVIRAITGPWPFWLEARFAAEDVIEPTGVAWWSNDLLIAATHRDHLIQLSDAGGVSLVLPGLSEPHPVTVDRRQIFVANVGENNIITAQIVHGQAAALREIDVGPLDPGLDRPHSATRIGNLMAIADTDNNRVVMGREQQPSSWLTLDGAAPGQPFRFPCGLHFSVNQLWVTNRDVGLIDLFELSPRPRHLMRFGDDCLVDPNALIRWRDFLIVADEQRRSLPVFRIQEHKGMIHAVDSIGELAVPVLGSPFGLSINRGERLAVADRDLGCVWTIALEHVPLLADVAAWP